MKPEALSDRDVWLRLDAALALLGVEPAQTQFATSYLTAIRLTLAAGVVGLSPENRLATDTRSPAKSQTVRLPVGPEFSEAMARFQQDNPELMTLDTAVAFILGSYLTEHGYSHPARPV